MEMMPLMKILGGTIPHVDRKEIDVQEELQVPIGIRRLRGFRVVSVYLSPLHMFSRALGASHTHY